MATSGSRRATNEGISHVRDGMDSEQWGSRFQESDIPDDDYFGTGAPGRSDVASTKQGLQGSGNPSR